MRWHSGNEVGDLITLRQPDRQVLPGLGCSGTDHRGENTSETAITRRFDSVTAGLPEYGAYQLYGLNRL